MKTARRTPARQSALEARSIRTPRVPDSHRSMAWQFSHASTAKKATKTISGQDRWAARFQVGSAQPAANKTPTSSSLDTMGGVTMGGVTMGGVTKGRLTMGE